MSTLKYSYDIDISRFYKKKTDKSSNLTFSNTKYKPSNRLVFTNRNTPVYKINKPVTNSRKKTPQKGKIKLIKHLNIYYGIFFIFLFCFLFFLSISISYASPRKSNVTENDFIYNNSNSLNLIKESINLDENKTVNQNTAAVITEQISFGKYIVKRQDTLYSIAKKYNVTEDSIILTNYIKKSAIKNGITLLIPNQNGRLITVQNNDSVYRIANRYGISWKKIADVNNLKSENLDRGSKIFVPGSKMSAYEKEKYLELDIYIWPIKGVITSFFGLRIDPFTKAYGYHKGIDIRNKYGTPVKSIAQGTVISTGYDEVYGNFITIKHKNGIVSKYGHLSKISVKRGSKVDRGTVIGNVGSTGRSTGSHLHFEVYKYGKLINPQKLYG